MIKELPRPKPASPPEVIEFLRELLITAHIERIDSVLYIAMGPDLMQAHGMISEKTSSRQVDRGLDMLEDWASDYEYDNTFEGDETGEE